MCWLSGRIFTITCMYLLFLGNLGAANQNQCKQWRDSLENVLRSDLENYFSVVRNHVAEGGANNKENASDYIESVFRGFPEAMFLTMVQDSTLADGLMNRNVIGVVKGQKWNESGDEIVLLGAHYDTVNGPGVDDNGSGAAALLEVARLLHSCRPKHSIMFVAFDLEECNENCLVGSRIFIEDFLIPHLSQSGSTFKGAYILDTIMNYETQPGSQDAGPIELAVNVLQVESFKPLLDEVRARNYSGDFLLAIARKSLDDHLLSAFQSKFPLTNVTKPAKLPYDQPNEQFQAGYFNDFYRSDHANFWNEDSLPAVYLTDTAEFRQTCTPSSCDNCYHRACDSKERMLDEDNVSFLGWTTQALARSLAELAEGQDLPEELDMCTEDGDDSNGGGAEVVYKSYLIAITILIAFVINVYN